jgi:carbon-monoxide dehydrogenase iron sulfur subunit
MAKKNIVVDLHRCVGCRSCQIACAVAHSSARTLLGALAEQPRSRPRVRVEQSGSFVVPLQCRHCEDAPCITVCPTAALHRDDTESPVVLREDACIGCAWCITACPFGLITFDDVRRMVVKCDLCADRLEHGEMPACVGACPTGALKYETPNDAAARKRSAALVRIVSGTEKAEEM